MAKSPVQMIAMMVDGAQPHCDEPLRSAMICSHAGSMTSALTSRFVPAGGGLPRTSELPNPVLIAVGPTTFELRRVPATARHPLRLKQAPTAFVAGLGEMGLGTAAGTMTRAQVSNALSTTRRGSLGHSPFRWCRALHHVGT